MHFLYGRQVSAVFFLVTSDFCLQLPRQPLLVNRRFFSNLQFNLCVSLKPSTSQTSLYCNSEQCSRLRNVLNVSNGNLGNIFLVARVKSTTCGAVRAFCKFQFFTLHFELSKKTNQNGMSKKIIYKLHVVFRPKTKGKTYSASRAVCK